MTAMSEIAESMMVVLRYAMTTPTDRSSPGVGWGGGEVVSDTVAAGGHGGRGIDLEYPPGAARAGEMSSDPQHGETTTPGKRPSVELAGQSPRNTDATTDYTTLMSVCLPSPPPERR